MEAWRQPTSHFLRIPFRTQQLVPPLGANRRQRAAPARERIPMPSSMWANKDPRLYWWQSLVAGGLSGVIPRTLTAPLDVIKTLTQEGILGFYKGNLTACIRLFPYSAVQFTAYDVFKNYLLSLDEGDGVYGPLAALSAGAGAGMIGTIAVYPLDVVKTRLTVDTKRAKYSGLTDAVRKIRVEEGFRGLRKGLAASVLGVVPFAGGMFMAYEALDDAWGVPKAHMTWKQNFFNGCLASAVAQTVSFPMDTIRKKMQAQSSSVNWSMKPDVAFKSTWEALVNTVKFNGVLGLWRGHFVNLLRVTPFNGSMFVTYEAAKRFFLYENGYTISPFYPVPAPEVDQSWPVEDLSEHAREVHRRIAKKKEQRKQMERDLADGRTQEEKGEDEYEQSALR